LPVDFTCDAHDPDGSITQYSIDYGDGTGKSTNTSGLFSHTYNTEGTYTAVCTAQDDEGAESSRSLTVKVESSGSGGGGACNSVPSSPTVTEVRPNGSPVNVGDEAADGKLSAGETMDFSINFPCYNGYVNLFAAILIPTSPVFGVLLFVDQHNQFVTYRGSEIPAFRKNTTGPASAVLFTGLPVTNALTGEHILPPGAYEVFTIVVPSNVDLSKIDWSKSGYELLYYTFTVE